MKYFQCTNILKQQDGSAMVIALMMMALLSIIGINAVTISSTEQQISVNAETQKMAFYDADSGVQYTLGSIENALENGVPNVLPTSIGSSVAYTYGTPAGFFFNISNISMTGSNVYSFTSTGNSGNAHIDAQAVISVTFRKGATNPIEFAAFGDEKLDTKNGGTTQSYDSSSADPTKNDPSHPSFQSTHEADVGSNDWLVTHNGAMIDGDGVFGEQDDGSATQDGIHGGTIFYGTAGVDAGRIDPDPLGINSGGVYDPTTYSASNDNATHATINGAFIAGDTISTSNGDNVTLTGKVGGSNFYFTSVELKNNVTLVINTTLGPVNIFLDGGGATTGTIFDAKNSSITNTSGNPTDFSIYSNSAQKIDFKHGSEFRGFVYAPLGDIDMKNSSAVYGALWGKTVDIKNSGTLYYDAALSDKYIVTTNDVSLLSWEEVQ
ncbi:MAG: pilus assembly PilX N-terminal domain-containing protein [Desulfobacterales bacterium]|nr:pilus assembly PilX N-terminal domain-containing protein [Desulfobacterales bacterium]